MASRSLWNYYRDETNDDTSENNAACNKINNNRATSKSFEYNNRKHDKFNREHGKQ